VEVKPEAVDTLKATREGECLTLQGKLVFAQQHGRDSTAKPVSSLHANRIRIRQYITGCAPTLACEHARSSHFFFAKKRDPRTSVYPFEEIIPPLIQLCKAPF
jgi:hypothetical protein